MSSAELVLRCSRPFAIVAIDQRAEAARFAPRRGRRTGSSRRSPRPRSRRSGACRRRPSMSTLCRRDASTTPPRPAIAPEIMKTIIRIAGDVDAGAARGLGVAADRVDVAPERRPLGEERPGSRARSRRAATRTARRGRLLQIATATKRAIAARRPASATTSSGSRIGDAVAALREDPAEHDRPRRARHRRSRDDPPAASLEEVVGDVVDRVVLDHDHRCGSAFWITPCQIRGRRA